MYQIIIKSFFAILVIMLFNSCKDDNMSTPPPLSSNLVGKWEWIKTINELGEVITPQTLGNNKSMSYGNSSIIKGDYLYIVKSEGEPIVLRQNNYFGKEELINDTLNIISQFDDKYVEFFLLKNSDNIYPELIMTDLVEDFSSGFGSARHYYKRVGAAEKPY